MNTYRQLQQTLKQLRDAGHIPQSFKLNQKKEILQAKLDEIKAIAFSKPTTPAAPKAEPTQKTSATPKLSSRAAFQLIQAFDNYIPAYELADAMGNLSPKEFWKWAYAQTRQGKLELSTLQEGFRYTPEQHKFADPAGYFFISFN